MKVTPILWTSYKLKDDTYALKICHFYIEGSKKNRNYYPLNISLSKNQWDSKLKRVKLHPNAMDINLKLVDIENSVEKEYLKDKSIDVESLIKSIIDPTQVTIEKKKELTLIPFMRFYIQECKDGKVLHYKTKLKLSEGYIKTIETSLGRLEWYCNRQGINPSFEHITEDFHDQCMHALRYEYELGKDADGNSLVGMAENSIGKTTKHLKRVMEYAKEKKLHTNFEFEKFVAVSQEVDNIALTDEEINRILNLKLTDKKTKYLLPEQERFSIAYNFLLRFNDSISINKKNIYIESGQPFFKMITGKTKQEVIIPIMPRNYEILKKNNFTIKPTNNQNSNERVKELGRLAGLDQDNTITQIRKGKTLQTVYKRYELISTHTTRRSAATNLYLAGVDLKRIQLMGGWKSMKQLEEYLKIDKLENAKVLAGHAFFNR